jgi:eukaryotic-like serine/threonine-protein kinase
MATPSNPSGRPLPTITSFAGGGGTGVVYEAEDAKLGRRVALKFLPGDLANGAQALSRFQREESCILIEPRQHLHDLDESDGRTFIAMELLEDQTRRHMIAGRPLANP